MPEGLASPVPWHRTLAAARRSQSWEREPCLLLPSGADNRPLVVELIELVRAGYEVLPKVECNLMALASTSGLPESVHAAMVDLDRALGGRAGYTNFTSGKWDFATADGLFIEFDEQLHFNRYRQLSDRLTWFRGVPWSTAYLHYSSAHEDQCLKAGSYGRKWTSPSTEKMFGQAAPPGVRRETGHPGGSNVSSTTR